MLQRNPRGRGRADAEGFSERLLGEGEDAVDEGDMRGGSSGRLWGKNCKRKEEGVSGCEGRLAEKSFGILRS